jgi:hypothetical protein
MYRKIFSIFSLMLVLAVAFSAVSPVAAQPSLKSNGGHVEKSQSGVYIFQMTEVPAVTYEGGIPGYLDT